MGHSIYIASAEARSGKSLVALGVAEIASGLVRRFGFFRPVVRGVGIPDPAIELIRRYYRLEFPYEAMYGCTFDDISRQVPNGSAQDVLGMIMEKYRALESQCDAVVCLGTDYTGIGSPLEFGFNAELANNLGCAVLPVANGGGKTESELVDGVLLQLRGLEARGCPVVAVVANRVAVEQRDHILESLRDAVGDGPPCYAVAEHGILAKPSIAEIADAIGGEWLTRPPRTAEREISSYQIAAMELPQFLERMESRSLVITPGDRADIILGSLLANWSSTVPQIAGLLLTGGIRPNPIVLKLLKGLRRLSLPILLCGEDTLSTAVRVSGLSAVLSPDNERKVAAALGLFESSVDVPELVERIQVTRPTRVTPLMFEYELLQRAKRNRQHIVLPEGTEERILRAAEILLLRGIVDLTLLGDEREVRRLANALGLRLEGARVVDPTTSELRGRFARSYFRLRQHRGISEEMAYDAMADVNYFATMMVHEGMAGGMVSGSVHTTQSVLRPAFEIIRTQAGCSIASSVFFMCLPERVLVYGDCAVNPDPNAAQLADIAVSSAVTAAAFHIEPRVALLSYSTGESGSGAEVEKVREATRLARESSPRRGGFCTCRP